MLYEDYKNLHQIPELGFKEFKTSTYIFNKVLSTKAQVDKIDTGICAFFDFKKKYTICFRAEEDALKIKEKNNIEFVSKHPNCMHACGHDAHMAIALSLLNYVNKLSDFPFNILFIFQPSEEQFGGALKIIPHLKKYNIHSIFGMHVYPGLINNKVYSSRDVLFASSNEVDIKTKAKSTHIGNYRKNNDAIYKAVNIANKLSLKAKKNNMLFQYGFIKGGKSRNITASSCLIKGTLRGYNLNLINSFIEENLISKKDIIFRYSPTIPPLINNHYYKDKIINDLSLGIIEKPFYQAEDFAFYGIKYNVMFFLLGINSSFLHTSSLIVKEDNLISGLNFYIKLLNYIRSNF